MPKRSSWRSRYSVLSILSACWVISYFDKAAMPVALPYIAAEFDLTPFQSSMVISVFFAGYAFAQMPGGILADKYGVRGVATTAMIFWSIFTAVTGAVSGFAQMLVTRLAFGLGEGTFPAAAFKAVAIWFPRKERGTANAVMLAANSLGAAASPIVVVFIMAAW